MRHLRLGRSIGMAFAAALSLALCQSGPAQAFDNTGPWYGAYDLDAGTPDIELHVEIDQLAGGDVGLAAISIFALTSDPDCPPLISVDLCRDLGQRFARYDQNPSVFDATTEGVFLAGDTALIGFRFGGKLQVLRIVMAPDRTVGQFQWLGMAGGRKLMQGQAIRSEHMCETNTCTIDRFDLLKRNPDAQLGFFFNPFNVGLFRLGDELAALSPRRFGGSKTTDRAPPHQAAPREAGLLGQWVLQDPNGKDFGRLSFDEKYGAIAGSGTIVDGAFFYGNIAVDLRERLRRGSAYDLSITYYAGQSGEQITGRLLLSPHRDGFKGTMLDPELGPLLVSLVRADGNSGGSVPVDSRDFASDDDMLESELDMPGIGVTGPAYRLRNVPPGRMIKLRSAPRRDAVASGTLGAEASEILVLGCSPQIDTMAFEEADQRGRQDLLATVWCEITHDQGQGYLPGLYLDPIDR